MRRQREHRDHAEAQQPEQRDHELGGVGQVHHHPVPGVQTECAQAVGAGVGAPVQRGVADPLAAGDDGGRVAVPGGPFAQQAAERLGAPVPLPHVPLGQLGGPADGAVEKRGGHECTAGATMNRLTLRSFSRVSSSSRSGVDCATIPAPARSQVSPSRW